MRHLRLVLPALALVVAGVWAIQVMACDDKTSNASAAAAGKSAACTAEMAAKCTPEMAAACMAKGAKGAKTAAFTASSSSCAAKATAATAATAASADHCAGKTSTAATAAAMGAYSGKGKTASSSHSCSPSATKASAAKGTASKSKVTAVAAGSSCSGRGMTTAAGKAGHGDCDACSDMALCHDELEAAGTRTQVVPLKNGVMFVYTAEAPGRANAVQSAMARRNERLAQIVTAGDKAHLCPECKTIRGAMASGKMTRELVNIEGGALTLMTSNDPAMVAKIHAMVESHKTGRSKI